MTESISVSCNEDKESMSFGPESEGNGDDLADGSHSVLGTAGKHNSDSKGSPRNRMLLRPSKLDETWNKLLKEKAAQGEMSASKLTTFENGDNRSEQLSRKRPGDIKYPFVAEAPKVLKVQEDTAASASGMKPSMLFLKPSPSDSHPGTTGFTLLQRASSQLSFADLGAKWNEESAALFQKKDSKNRSDEYPPSETPDDLVRDSVGKELLQSYRSSSPSCSEVSKEQEHSDEFQEIGTPDFVTPEELDEIDLFIPCKKIDYRDYL